MTTLHIWFYLETLTWIIVVRLGLAQVVALLLILNVDQCFLGFPFIGSFTGILFPLAADFLTVPFALV